ncbi:DUF1810 family protein [uncultured Odoribacter sp.]
MAQDIYNLIHFLDAQRKTYSVVLQKLYKGRKRSHWMRSKFG